MAINFYNDLDGNGHSLVNWTGLGGSSLTNEDITSATAVTVTPGVSNERLFITPTATIDLIVETAGADNQTFFTFVNLDPASFDINIKIDNAGNPIIITLNSAVSSINCAYTGTDYRFWA